MTKKAYTNKAYLDMINSREYIQLHHYYMRETYLDILGVARQENPHSAFIRWLLDDTATHELRDYGIRKLLETAILAFDKMYDNTFCHVPEFADNLLLSDGELCRQILLSQYTVSNLKVDNEKPLKNKRRADILLTFDLNTAQTYPVTVVIENKIKSEEGTSVQNNITCYQTEEYYRQLNEGNHENSRNLFLYLFPETNQGVKTAIGKAKDEGKGSRCLAKSAGFITLTYQYLLDGVIEPCCRYCQNDEGKARIIEYIRCLGQERNLTNKDGTEKTDTLMMAVSSQEKQWVNDLWQAHRDAVTELLETVKEQREAFPSETVRFWRTICVVLQRYVTLSKTEKPLVNSFISTTKKHMFVFNGNYYESYSRDASIGKMFHDMLIRLIADNQLTKAQQTELRDKLQQQFGKGWLRRVMIFQGEEADKKDVEEHYFAVNDPAVPYIAYIARYWGNSNADNFSAVIQEFDAKNVIQFEEIK